MIESLIGISELHSVRIDLFALRVCFPNTDHVRILRRVLLGHFHAVCLNEHDT